MFLKKWRIALVLSCVGLCLATATYFLNRNAVDQLMKQEARETSTRWTEQLVDNIQEIDKILAGLPPSDRALTYLRFVADSHEVDHFDIYTKSGELVLESKKLGNFRNTGTSLGEHNSEVLDVVEEGKPFVIIEDEEEEGKKIIIAETYLPIMRDNTMIGVASVYTDQTQLAASLQSRLTKTSAFIALLSALGFALPAAGAVIQMMKRREADEQVAYLAKHDVLTGLPNRRSIESDLQPLLDACGEKNELAAIHFVDVDFFKEINDRYGHSFGDEVLKAFAKRLSEVAQDCGIAGRFGGDEFIVLQTGFNSVDELGRAVQRLHGILAMPFDILGKTLAVTASIGTAMYPANGVDADELMTNADTALYAVKMKGRNGQKFYDPEFRSQKKRRTELEMLVREHTAAKTFELHYQPLYHLADHHLKGFEVLLRMRAQDGTFISPAEFVPIAEDIGLIDDIGSWVIEQSCITAKTWPSQLQVSVNLSAVQFRRKSVVGAVKRALTKSGLPPEQLLLEVTESLLMIDVEGVLEQLNELKRMGTSLAMDDFGTGFSSLSYMIRFPFDRIKIDRSFVNQLSADDAKAKKVVQTIVALGHNMEMEVTAEGVETNAQADVLQSLNCDDVQGFLYSRPVPVTDVASLIMKNFQLLQGEREALPQALSA